MLRRFSIAFCACLLLGASHAAPLGKPTIKSVGCRSELTFKDGTIVRKGCNTQLRFVSNSREIIVEEGTVLFSSPKKAGGGLLRAGTAVATMTTHGDVEILSTASTTKVICLNGKVQVRSTRDLGQRTNLGPGEMVTIPLDAAEAPPAVTISLPTLVKTSELLKMGPLPSDAQIQKNALKQKGPPNTGLPGASNEVISGAAMTTARITEQQSIQAQQASALAAQQAARQVQQQQAAQNAARIASARQLAEQQAVAQQQQQQQQQAAADNAARQIAQRQAQGNQGQGPQGNQGQGQGNQGRGPQGNQGNQGQGQGQGNQGQGGGQGRQ